METPEPEPASEPASAEEGVVEPVVSSVVDDAAEPEPQPELESEPEPEPETSPEPEPAADQAPADPTFAPASSAPSMAMIEQLRPAIIGGGIVDPCDFQPPPPTATPETAAPEPAKPEPVTEDTVIVAGAPIAIPPAGTTPWDAEDDEPPAKGASNPDYPGIDPSQ